MPATRGFKIATVFGLPIKIDPSWFFIIVLLSWTLAQGYFPRVYMGLEPAVYWFMGIAAALLLFFSVLLHELGHALIAKKSGTEVGGITLFMFGGVSELSEEPTTAGGEFRITVAGWLVSGVLAVVFLLASMMFSGQTEQSLIMVALLQYLALANGVLFVFNAVPGFPLDGGRMLRAALWKLTGSLRKATYWASSVGAGIGMLLIVFGLVNFLYGQFIGGVWFALIGLFLRTAAKASYQQVLVRRALEGVPIANLMTSNVVTAPPDATLDQLVDSYFMKYHFHSLPVLRDGELLGLVTMRDIKDVDEEERPRVTAADLVEGKPDKMPPTLSPDDDAMDAMGALTASGWGRAPVLQGGQLVGIVSRRDLMHFLAVKTDLVPEPQ